MNLQARLLASAAVRAGMALRHDAFTDTVALDCADPDAMMARALEAGFNLRRLDGQGVGIALDETVTRDELHRLAGVLGASLIDAPPSIPANLLRGAPVLPQAVFSAYHAEHEMMRYLKRLEDRDIALNRSMIPWGRAP